MTAKFIQERLERLFNNHEYILRNAYIFDWESDLFSVTKTGTVYETEIKVSRSDFRADFEKEKHKLFENHRRGIYQIKAEQENTDRWGADLNMELWYGPARMYEAYPHCRQKWVNSEAFFIPNRFYFATPPGLLAGLKLPSYAGLIECGEDGHPIIVKSAPFMHKRPLLAEEKMKSILLDKFHWLAVRQRYELDRVFKYHRFQK